MPRRRNELGTSPSAAPNLRRQVSFWVPRTKYLRLREEAARRQLPLSDLILEFMEPEFSRLMQQRPTDQLAP